MSKIKVIYWSQSGNTEAMAKYIVKGIAEAGKEGEALFVSNVSSDDLKNDNIFALGCPAMGAEVLEEYEMEPFIESLESSVSGKKIALFGSYGWGDGEWMRNWVERMSSAGATIINDDGLICQEMTDEKGELECIELGKKLASI